MLTHHLRNPKRAGFTYCGKNWDHRNEHGIYWTIDQIEHEKWEEREIRRLFLPDEIGEVCNNCKYSRKHEGIKTTYNGRTVIHSHKAYFATITEGGREQEEIIGLRGVNGGLESHTITRNIKVRIWTVEMFKYGRKFYTFETKRPPHTTADYIMLADLYEFPPEEDYFDE